MHSDLPPKLWLPQKPAIIRAESLRDVEKINFTPKTAIFLPGFKGATRSRVETAIAAATGTIMPGDFTEITGSTAPAYVFDGDTSGNTYGYFHSAATVGRIGKDWGSGNAKIPSRMKTWGVNGAGYCNFTSPTVTLKFQVGNTDPTTNSWTADATVATITPFTNVNTVNAKDTGTNANTTAYRYWWYECNLSAGNFMWVSEVQFFEWL